MKITDQLFKKGRKGSGFLLIAVITASLVGVTAVGLTKVNQAALCGFNNSKIMVQAQQYADFEATMVRATNYFNLEDRAKTEIQNSDGFYSEINVSDEINYLETFKKRNVTVNIYKGNEELPRYSLTVPKLDVDVQSGSGGVPAGTIIAWGGNGRPTECGTWLLCDGSSFTPNAYPKLYMALGSSVLPNLNGRFLEGSISDSGYYKEAGLPNITGTCNTGAEYFNNLNSSGALFTTGLSNGTRNSGIEKDKNKAIVNIDASLCSSVYGKSDTVQPAAYTVKYFIKAD